MVTSCQVLVVRPDDLPGPLRVPGIQRPCEDIDYIPRSSEDVWRQHKRKADDKRKQEKRRRKCDGVCAF